MPKPVSVKWIRRRLLGWGREHFRPFSWRAERDPYRLLVTEVLLKQTTARQVASVRTEVLSRYPGAAELANAEPEELAADIHTLGFSRQRALGLQQLGSALVAMGRVPTTVDALRRLPAVGPYTASAVACFAFGRRQVALDVNVARIIARIFAIAPKRGELRKNAEVVRLASALTQGPSPREINWALLDLGAEICRPLPRCPACPLAQQCNYGRQDIVNNRGR